MKEDILHQVAAAIGELNQSETKVASCVLAAPENIIHETLASIAQKAGVSEPTVLRFCRSLGYKGFKDFKLALAASCAGEKSRVQTSIQADDTIAVMAKKVCQHSANSISALETIIDSETIGQCVELFTRAKRVEIYGSGVSGIVALDAQYKLLHTKTLAIAHCDSHLQMMSAAGLDAKCVALVISWSGESRNIIDAAKMAKDQGATVVGVTSSNSSLAMVCDLVIVTPKFKNAETFSPMVSNLCQLTMIDILTIGIALQKGYIALDYKRKIKESVEILKSSTGC